MCHVLIIEDEALVACDIEQTLRDEGATSFAHADTEDLAVTEARRAKPAVITSDVNLRTGQGPAAVRRIGAELGEIPALYITATPEECLGRPEERVFTKPLDDGRLRQAFREVAPAWRDRRPRPGRRTPR